MADDDESLVYVPVSEAQAPMGDAGVLETDLGSSESFERPRGGGCSRIGCVGHHHFPQSDVTEEEEQQLKEAGFDV